MVGAIRHQHPDAEISFVAMDAGGAIAERIAGIDHLLVFRRSALNTRLCLQLASQPFDLALDVTGNDRSAFLTLLSGAKQRVTYRRKKAGLKRFSYNACCEAGPRDLHTIDFHLALLKAAGQDSTFQGWSMKPIPSNSATPYIVLHPGSARKEKYWLAERWAGLADWLAARFSHRLILTCGTDPWELSHAQTILKQTKAPLEQSQPPLSTYIELIAQASLVISVDTVATHLAAAYERPQVVLYGPINPYHWRPRHENARIICAGSPKPVTEFSPRSDQRPMDQLELEAVLEGIGSLQF